MKEIVVLTVLLCAIVSTHAQCADQSRYCRGWVRYCNRPNVKSQCPQTCGTCPGSCSDSDFRCPGWISYCRAPGYDHVKRMCPKTCGVCRPQDEENVSPFVEVDENEEEATTPNTQSPPVSNGPIGTVQPGVCGQPAVQGSRVIAGQTAVAHSWPWQILMLQNGNPGCGGSLISPTWVVTAAHCVYKSANYPRSFSVRVGEHDQRRREGNEVDHRVERVVVHPRWNPRSFDYDIALFKLSRPVQMNNYVSPVCLPNADVPVGTDCYITGWGKIRHPGNMHYVLQQAKMPVVDSRTCYNRNRRIIPVPITDRMICAGSGGSSRISGCHGDSGGPFVCKIGGRWELHGAVSHGSNDCSSRKTYTVFARVSNLKTWIKDMMNRY